MAALVVAVGGVCIGFRSEGQSVGIASGPPGLIQSNLVTQSVLGDATNGMQAEITIQWPQGRNELVEGAVYVRQPPSIYKELTPSNIDWVDEFMRRMVNNDWPYYSGTNEFCGPMELRNATGQEVTPLKPAVCLLETYPASFSLNKAKWAYLGKFRGGIINGAQAYPPGIVMERTELASFKPADYFEIKQPGEYHLTVWPKIYKKSSTNTDLCERFDLPPMTISFQWPGETSK